MSLADHGPQQVNRNRRKIDAFFLSEEQAERPFGEFLERELTEPRIGSMLRGMEICYQNNDILGFCEIANVIALIRPDRLPREYFTQQNYTLLVSSISESSPTNFNFQVVRAIENLFPNIHANPEQQRRIEDVALQSAQICIRDMSRFSEGRMPVNAFYKEAFWATMLRPEMRSSLPVKRETAQQLADLVKTQQSNRVLASYGQCIKDAVSITVVQPEYADLFSFEGAEQKFREYLQECDSRLSYIEMADVFETVAILAAGKVEIPSRGKLVLRSRSRSQGLSRPSPLPPQIEY